MEPVATFYDNNGFKTLVFDNAMPESAVSLWLEARKNIKFYKTVHDKIPMDFRVYPVNTQDRKNFFNLNSWLQPYLTAFHKDLDVDKGFARSFINCYQKNDHIRVHADLNPKDFTDEELYAVVLLFLTPDEYINDPTDCGFVINNSFTTKDFIVHNKFNRMVIMDARSLHEPVVPTDNFQRLTLYAGYTISPNNDALSRVSRENRLIEFGQVPGTRYEFNESDWINVD